MATLTQEQIRERISSGINEVGTGGSVARFTQPPSPAPAQGGSRASFTNQVRAQFPWMDATLVRTFVDEWLSTGSPEQAMRAVRASDRYGQVFAGNTRRDGSTRYSEAEYMSVREGMERALAGYQVNPAQFRDHITRAIEGDVSPAEFAQRLNMKWERVALAAPEVREEYSRFFGTDTMSNAAMFAAALDPKIGRDILERRIDVAEVAGEYAMRGYRRSLSRINTLLAAGVDQRTAAQVAGAAKTAVPLYQAFAQRFNDQQKGFSLEQFEDATVLNDSGQRQRMSRLQASEKSMFTDAAGMLRQDRESGGVSGLRER